jgi:adenine-specific DNA methylase
MKRLLIEEGLPFEAINQASHREKSGNSPDHPRRLHLWWARRPLAMSRAIVLGSVLPDPGDDASRRRVYQALEACSLFKDTSAQKNIEPLRELVRDAYPGAPPKVLDCFAGGGAIPLEALRLGCDTTAVDLNPVAHLIERSMLEFPQRFGTPDQRGNNSLSEDVKHWGEWVAQRAQQAVGHLYPTQDDETQPLLWFWARTMPCHNPSCAIELPLVTTWWLARSRQRVWLVPSVVDGRIQLALHDKTEGEPSAHPVMRASSATCLACGTTASAQDVRVWAKKNAFGLRLLAVLESAHGKRRYRLPADEEMLVSELASNFLASREDLEDGTSSVPDEQLDHAQARTLRMLIYGLDRYRELFTPRQLAVAVALTDAVRSARAEMCARGMNEDRARAVSTYLGLLISRIVDYNSAFCPWNVVREVTGHTFGRQSIPMVWDFTEINPFAPVPGNWEGGVRSVSSAIVRCSDTGSQPARIQRGNAQALDGFADGTFDAVVADPPYYDAVQYADLSDYFYVWLKRSLGPLYPELFAAPLTPKAQEVIENRADKKSAAYISSAEFEARLARSIAEMRRVVKPDGAVTIVFAHTESDAWERLLRALLGAGLVVSTSWPMQSEMGSRSTANLSAVLGSSVVLVCRPRTASETAFYDDVVRELDQRIGERLDEFERLGLQGADYLISAIGPAFEVFGKYVSVQRLNGEEVTVGELLALARRTVARHAMRRLLGSEALSAVDDVSLFYLTWRWAFGSARIPVDEAQKLGKAFNVEAGELDGVDGLVETSRDTYALRGPDDRKRIKLGVSPSLIDVLHVACKLFEQGRRTELAEVLAGSDFAEEPAFWAAARAVAESLPDGDRERILLVNLLGGQSQTVEAARRATPNEVLRLFEVNT